MLARSKIFAAALVAISFVACTVTDSTTIPEKPTCKFQSVRMHTDTLKASALPRDTNVAYEYFTNDVPMDSLLVALCNNGFAIKEGWITPPVVYLCKDARGPRPVVVLDSADVRMRALGFTRGLGRFFCGTEVIRYTPQ
jgi:hypothetical protein